MSFSDMINNMISEKIYANNYLVQKFGLNKT